MLSKQPDPERIEQARRAGVDAFPNATRVKPVYSPSSPTSDYLVEVWNGERAIVVPVVHGAVVIA